MSAEPDLAAIVKHTNPVSFLNPSWGSVLRVDLQQFGLFHLLQGRKVAEARIQIIVGLSSQKLQRKAACLFRVPRFCRWHERCHGIEALRRKRLTVQFRLATCRGEAAIGKRKKRLAAEVQVRMAFS